MQSNFSQPTRTQETFKNPKSDIDFHFYYKNFFGLHDHDFYEFLIMTEGKTLHSLNNVSTIIKKSTAVLIRPGESHQAFPYRDEKSEHLTISITKSALQNLCNTFSNTLFNEINEYSSILSFHLTDDELRYLLLLTDKLNTLPVDLLNAETIKTSKLIILNLLINFHALPSSPTYPEWLQSFLLQLAQPENFSKRLNELYKLVPYSQSFVNNHFKKLTGKTIIAHVTELRLNYACNLLKNTNFSILYISLTIGYDSLAHFNRTFKKNIGISPSLYRKKYISTF